MPKEIRIVLSDKAKELLDKYRETTGLGDEARVVEEALFTIHELLALAEKRSKSEPNIPAELFMGIISTFQRFKPTSEEY